MSLINEALKKVSEAERGKSPKTDFEMRAMQPAPYERRTSPLIWIAIPVLVVAVGFGGFLLARTSQRPVTQTATASAISAAKPAPVAEQPKVATEVPKPVSAPAPAVAEQSRSQPAPEPAPAPVATAPTQTQSPAPVTQPAPTPTSPPFRLKGILYSKNPTALINDAAVQTGGEIDGATVTKIDATAVTLDYQGKVTVLKLGARQTAN
jgi:hypothetical protein